MVENFEKDLKLVEKEKVENSPRCESRYENFDSA